MRRNWMGLLFVSLSINVGMWLERFNIVITSLSKDFLPSNWVSYTPTVIDSGVFAGTIGLFGVGVLLFMRYIPMMAISELKGVAHIGSKIED
jgi:Ni/Fe-hydrogenase subunit HybB-like protein